MVQERQTVIVRPGRIATLCLVLLTLMAAVVFGFYVRGQVLAFQKHRLHGTLTGTQCSGLAGLRDLPVYIHDQSDNLLGYARTAPVDSGPNYCKVSFSAIVSGADMYQLTFGTHDAPAYTFDQLQQLGWTIDLHLGS